MRFVDTNILLYAISTAAGERKKQQQALRLLECDDIALSVQVLLEFCVQTRRASQKHCDAFHIVAFRAAIRLCFGADERAVA